MERERSGVNPWSSGSSGPPAGSPAASLLARRLRTLVYDGTSQLPSLVEAMGAARGELEAAQTIGVLFVRIDYVGKAAHALSYEDVAAIYATLTTAAQSLIGVHLRKVDLPADLGLAGEGFAVLLSRPRDHEGLCAEEVARVAERYGKEIWRAFSAALPVELARRVAVHVGGGVVRRPGPDATVEEVVIAGLEAAYADALVKEEAHLARLASSIRSAVEQGRLDIMYQPIADLETRSVVGYDVGLASAGEAPLDGEDALFDIARRTGLAASAYRAYHLQALSGAEGALAANEWLLLRTGAADLISSAVMETSALFAERAGSIAGLSPANVTFLVDAGDVLGNLPASMLAFRSAADMGFRLGVDVTFGGLPPLDHIRGLCLDLLRIGGRLVEGLADDPDVFDVASLLVRFAHRHGMVVLAANVGSPPQLERLRSIGVDLVQGAFVAPYADTPVRAPVGLA